MTLFYTGIIFCWLMLPNFPLLQMAMTGYPLKMFKPDPFARQDSVHALERRDVLEGDDDAEHRNIVENEKIQGSRQNQ